MNLREERNRIREMMGLISEQVIDFKPPRRIIFDVFQYEEFIILDDFQVPEQYKGMGYGTKLMNKLIKHADMVNLPVIVEACDGYGTPLDELIRFYGKFNFELFEGLAHKNTTHCTWLIRTPNI
jgi:GNAT superfamily N-acetyltransferase